MPKKTKTPKDSPKPRKRGARKLGDTLPPGAPDATRATEATEAPPRVWQTSARTTVRKG